MSVSRQLNTLSARSQTTAEFGSRFFVGTSLIDGDCEALTSCAVQLRVALVVSGPTISVRGIFVLRLIHSLLLILLVAGSAVAHPGHGSAQYQDGVLHYVTSPAHAGSTLLAVIAVVASVRWLCRRDKSDRA